jgi:hypothetical protein
MYFYKRLLTALFVPLLIGASSAQQGNDAQSEHRRNLQREQWFARGRTIPGENSALLRLHAVQQKMQMRTAQQAEIKSMLQVVPHGTTAPGAAWTPLGPAPFTSDASGTGVENYGAVSGRATAIAIDPADPGGNTIYIGGAYGGVWKSQNAANLDPSQVQWVSLTDNLHDAPTTGCAGAQSVPQPAPTLAIGSIAVQPGNTNTANSVILAGTGEPDSSVDSYYGVGILRFTQGGNAWCLISQAASGQSFAGLGFSKIAFSTSNPNLVVAAAAATSQGLVEGLENPVTVNRGIYYSNDAGQTWNYATIKDGGTTIAPESVTSVVYNAIAGEFFAAVRNHGFYVSANGSSWTRLTNQPGAGLSTVSCPATQISNGCPLYRGEIAVVPGRNEMYTWFISLDSTGDEIDQGIWETSSGGATWTQLDASSIANCGDLVGCGIGDGAYNLALSAVPDGAATDLYAGSVNLYKCEITSLQQNPIECGGSGNQFLNLTHAFGCIPDLGSIAQVHPDQHAIASLVTNGHALLFFANDGGIYRALDGYTDLTSGTCGQANENEFDDLNGTLGSLTQFVSFAQSPDDPNTLLGGAQGNGSPASSTAETSANWLSVNTGDGGYSAINAQNPSEWFTENAAAGIERCTSGINCRSSDFAPIVEPETVGGDHGAFFTPYILDPQAASDELVVGTCRVWRGPGDGGPFTALSNSFETGAGGCTGNEVNLVRSLAAGGPLQNGFSNVIYAGTDGDGPLQTSAVQGGRVWVTTNAAGGPATWNDVTGAINPDEYPVSGIALDPSDANGNTAYLTIMGFHTSHVWKTTGAGAIWTDFSGSTSSLPDSPANALVIDPQGKTIFVGTDVGVFSSSTTNPAWTEVGPASGAGVLPNVAVTALEIFDAGGIKKLRASTYGRGMWEIALVATPDFSLNISTTSQTIFPGQSASFSGSAPAFHGYSNLVSLTCIAGATPAPQTCNITPSSITPTTAGANFSIVASDAIGDYSFRIHGSGADGTTHDTPLTLHVVDFSLSAPNQSTLIVPRGTTSSSLNFSVTSVGSFHGTVNFSCAGLPAGATCNFTPSAANPISNTPANVSLTVTVPLATAAGNDPVTIQATSSGASAKTQTFTLNVILNPDFVLSAGLALPTVKSGGTANGTFNVTTQDGFTGSVALSCATSQGTGNCSVSPSNISAYPASPSVTFNATGIAAGNSSLTVTGTSGASTHTLTVPFNVSDYQIAATAASTPAGQMAASTLTITPVNGYTGNISLACDTSALSGATCTFNPASPSNVGATPVQVAVAIAVPANAQNKVFSITVNAQDIGGAPQHSIAIPVTVAGDFTITPVNSSLTIQAGQQAQFALNVNSTNGAFNGAISFTCAGSPSTSNCSFSPASVTPGNVTSAVTMTIATTAPTAALRFTGKSSFLYALLFPLGLCFQLGYGFARKSKKRVLQIFGLAALLATLISCGGGGLVGNNSVTARPGTSLGTYTITITGTSGSLSHTAQVTLIVQ